MRILFYLVAAFIMLFSITTADSRSAVKVAEVPEGAIEIDGMLAEPEWQDAEKYFIKSSLGSDSPAVETVFRMLWDKQSLYLGVVCRQPDMDSLRVEQSRRSASIWADDSIQFFIDPGGSGGPFFQIMANAIGAVWDARYIQGRDSIPDWKMRGLEVATTLGDESWTLEMRIPFSNLLTRHEDAEPRITPDSWRFNLARTFSGAGPRLLSYAELSDYFSTRDYAPIKGLDIDYDLYSWKLGPLQIKDVSPREDGSYRVDIEIGVANLSQRFQAFSLDGEIETADEEVKPAEIVEYFAAGARETRLMPFSINVPESGVFPLTAELTQLPSRVMTAWRRFDVEVDASPLQLEVLYPYYRSAIYHDMEVDAVRLGLDTRWEAPWGAGDKLRLRILNNENTIITERVIEDPDKFRGEHELKIPDIATGDYSCIAEILQDGEVSYAASAPLSVYPPSESVVRVNEHRNIVINGKETFLVGMFGAPWGMHQSQKCNMGHSYSACPDLDENPEIRDRLEELADKGRWLMRFPHPRHLWPHIIDGRPELALRPLPSEDAREISERVAQYRDVRGMLAWYLADEPALTRFLPSYLEAVRDAVHEGDPYRPAYISFNNAGALRHYSEAIDVVGIHWYCMFTDAGPLSPLSTVADHIKLAHELTGNRKAVINAPLFSMYAHGGDVRMPTHAETRCMTYLGIVHGARGIMWYSTYGLTGGLEPRIGLPILIDELLELEPVLLSHEEIDIPVTGGDADAIHVLGKRFEDELYIIAVNAEPEAKAAILRLPNEWADISSIREIDSDKERHDVRGGNLQMRFESYDVRIFSTAVDAPRLVTRQEAESRFESERRRLLETGDLCYSGSGATIHPSPDFGRFWEARLLNNGYYSYKHFLPRRNMKKGSWVEIRFPEHRMVGRIQVSSSDLFGGNLPFRAYHLELKTDQGWESVEGEIAEEIRPDSVLNRNIYIRTHSFTGREAEALRLTMTSDANRGEYPVAIKAFAP